MFLAEWSKNNNREWFSGRKLEYQQKVLFPSQMLLEQVTCSLSEHFDDAFDGKIFRVHRDVRFSKDKTPYSPSIRMAFWLRSRDPKMHPGAPCFFFRLSDTVVAHGSGTRNLDSASLARFRSALADQDQGRTLNEIVSRFLSNKEYHHEPPVLKRLPSGVPPDHPWASFWLHKQFRLFNTATITGCGNLAVSAPDVTGKLLELRPLFTWFSHVMKA